MADIDIQKKSGPGIWPWIVGLLLLVLVVWGVTRLTGTDDDTGMAADTTAVPGAFTGTTPGATGQQQPGQPTAGVSFQAWLRDSAQAGGQMGQEHEYTREGVQRLMTAVEGLVARDTAPQVQQRLQTAREQVRLIRESDPSSTQHAQQARQAFTALVEILELLQDRPHLQQANLREHVQAARQSAESVNPGTPLLQQRAAVHQYFEHMGEAVQAAERHYVP
jgi:hypothetical protein